MDAAAPGDGLQPAGDTKAVPRGAPLGHEVVDPVSGQELRLRPVEVRWPHQGELVDRLQLPSGYSLMGFGKGKVVYLSMRDAQGIHLARVQLR